jgi:hypothetical protein
VLAAHNLGRACRSRWACAPRLRHGQFTIFLEFFRRDVDRARNRVLLEM